MSEQNYRDDIDYSIHDKRMDVIGCSGRPCICRKGWGHKASIYRRIKLFILNLF